MVMNGNPGCPLPPPSFNETDLIGTWVGKPGTATFTTLTLYDDHTYKQIYKDPYINLVYESEGKPKWRLELRESGIHLLHLEKMKDCDNNLSSCEKNIETKPAPVLWGDPCEGTLIKQNEEVILLITGIPKDWAEKFPRNILLRYLEPDPDANPKLFQLNEGQ
jgi:hypothetical protein